MNGHGPILSYLKLTSIENKRSKQCKSTDLFTSPIHFSTPRRVQPPMSRCFNCTLSRCDKAFTITSDHTISQQYITFDCLRISLIRLCPRYRSLLCSSHVSSSRKVESKSVANRAMVHCGHFHSIIMPWDFASSAYSAYTAQL